MTAWMTAAARSVADAPSLVVYLITTLVTAHLVADFLVQSDQDAEDKRNLKWTKLVSHGLVHGALAYVVVGIWRLWLPLIALLLVHVGIDVLKELARRATNAQSKVRAWPELTLLGVDQALHLAAIVGTALVCGRVVGGAASSTWQTLLGAKYMEGCIYVAGLVVSVWAGSVVVRIITKPRAARLDGRPGSGSGAQGLVGAGKLIGQLERTLIYLLVLSGHLPAVGFLVAAKSVFRFGELRDRGYREEAEYILIGTLASFTWAILAAGLARSALGLV